MADDLSVLRCPRGHGLGLVREEASGASYLMLYRHAIDLDAVDPAEVDVVAVINWAIEIRCDICDGIRAWWPNRRTVEKLSTQRH